MKNYGFDLSFRPDYWGTKRALVSNIKGTFRRARVLEATSNGTADAIPQAIRSPSLSEAVLRAIAPMPPSLWAGEYLPDFEPGEVEIARMKLESSTDDVISVRARPDTSARIAYRVVDEYPDHQYQWSPGWSRQPLSLGRLIHLIDHVRMRNCEPFRGSFIRSYWEYIAETCDPDEAIHFIQVTSTYYPTLHGWYKAAAERWHARRVRRTERR